MKKISVVIPVYRAEAYLNTLHQRLKKSLEEISDEFEIIMVEDCGDDRSWDIILEICQLDRRVKGIKLGRNFGQHNALLCGIRLARYEIIVTMDDDLQHPPEEISKLTDKLSEGYDVVFGAPQINQQGFLRNITTRVTKTVIENIMGVKMARQVSSFRAFHRRLRDAFINYNSPFVSIDALLAWTTAKFTSVSVRHDARAKGVSNYTLRRLILYTLNLVTGFTVLPLQFASLIGLIFTIFGFFVLLYVILRYLLQGNRVPGFPFLASVIAIFSGVQLFTLGIIGEYLARIHFKIMERPSYVIQAYSEEVVTKK